MRTGSILFRCLAVLILLLAVASGSFWWGVEQRFPFNDLKRWQKSRSVALPIRATIHKTFARKSDVVMIGDSLTAGIEWQEVFPQLIVVNRGIGGETTADILKRMDSIVPTQAKRAFIMAGINDVVEGVSLDDAMANYTAIVAHLRAHGADVVIQSTIECSCGATRVARVRELNERLRTFSSTSKGVSFLNVNPGLVNAAGLDPVVTTDGIHLNAEGYRRWVKNLASVM